MPITEEHPDFVTAFSRGLSVIKTFERGAERQTLSEVAAKTGLSRASVRRFLLTLEAIGYVAQEGNTFRLLPKVLDLGYAYMSSIPLWELAQPLMKNIVDEIDESCSLAVLDGYDVVYLARVPPRHVYTIPVQVGMRMPPYVNAMGRVLLADQDDKQVDDYLKSARFEKLTPKTVTDPVRLRRIIEETRRNGYAMAEHEVYEGRCSLAVPVRNREGKAVASLNVSAMMSRASKDDFLNRFLPLLRQAAATLGDSL